MRFLLSLAVLGVALSAGVPAFAQGMEQQQPGYSYGGNYGNAPMYNGGGNQGSTAGTPLYNSGANLQMLPLPSQNAVAGKNAPSYSYNHSAANQPSYSNQQLNGGGAVGGLSPEQARGLNMQRQAAAQAYQQQYLANRQQQGASPNNNNASQYQGAQFNQLYNANQDAKPAVKKKYVYKKPASPLTAPPPLFNVER